MGIAAERAPKGFLGGCVNVFAVCVDQRQQQQLGFMLSSV